MLKRNHGNLSLQTAEELVEYSSCQYRQPRIVQWNRTTKRLFIALVNQAIHRTRRITPTIDLKSQIYTCVHLVISEDFSQIITFTTLVGIRWYKLLFFGLNCASEIIQDKIAQVINGILDTRNISDDIIVFGSTQGGKSTKHILNQCIAC